MKSILSISTSTAPFRAEEIRAPKINKLTSDDTSSIIHVIMCSVAWLWWHKKISMVYSGMFLIVIRSK